VPQPTSATRIGGLSDAAVKIQSANAGG
jgi:hypothetical protein